MIPYRFHVGTMFFMTMLQIHVFREEVPVLMPSLYRIKLEDEKVPCKSENTTGGKNRKIPLTDTILSEKEAEIIAEAYMWGYIISIIPSAILAEKYSPKAVIMCSLFAAVLVKSFRIIMYGFEETVGLRFAVGFFGGCVYPAINILIAKWAPRQEKGKFMAATVMGGAAGVILSTCTEPLNAEFLGKYGYLLNTISGLGFLVLFYFMVTDSPKGHRKVTGLEENEIRMSQRGLLDRKREAIPFLKILKSGPLWALCFAEFCNLWNLGLVLNFTPIFKSKTMNVAIRDEPGLYTLPYVARFFGSFMFGMINDMMMREGDKSVTKIRIFFTIFSHFVSAVFLFLIRAGSCFSMVVTLFLFLQQLFNSASVVTTLINPQDLAPNFVGTCFGFVHFFGMSCWLMLPKISQLFMRYFENSLTGVAINYAIGGVLLIMGGTVFVVFGSGEMQPWNEIVDEELE